MYFQDFTLWSVPAARVAWFPCLAKRDERSDIVSHMSDWGLQGCCCADDIMTMRSLLRPCSIHRSPSIKPMSTRMTT